MSENINQNGQQPTTPTPEASGGQGKGRTFTQEEVNRIVADRLAREKAKAEPSPADEREQALKAREAKLDCREYLDAQCQRRCDFVIFRRTGNVRKWRVKVCSL